jgi:hypothetical protein
MSFSILPPETQQLVVDLCYRADERYWERVGWIKGKMRKGELEGRSCFMVSQVNKSLRAMAVKHLFGVSREKEASSFSLLLTDRQISC